MTQITREEIERLIADVRDHHIRRNMADNFPRQSETFALMRRLEVAIVGEPARIEAARREGEAAGIEWAAQWHDDRIPGELVMGMNSAANADRAAADAIRSLAPAPAAPSDGWITWTGGACPVPPDTFVDVNLRDVEDDEHRGPASAFDWTHQGDNFPCDIVAYRVQVEAEPSAPVAPSADDDDAMYEIGKRDGYEEAVQDIDVRTGGDGEYYASTIPGRGCPDPSSMIQGIVDRFEAGTAQAAEVAALRNTMAGLLFEVIAAAHGRTIAMRMAQSGWRWPDNARVMVSPLHEAARALLQGQGGDDGKA